MEQVESASEADELLARACELKKSNSWPALADLAPLIPEALDGPWLAVADEVAFALGQLHRNVRKGATVA